MFEVIIAVLRSLAAGLLPRRQLVLENLALRHQLLVLSRNAKRPRFRNPDRLLWIVLRAVWSRWEKAVVIIQPQTVIGWHRAGFRRYWRWKSRRRDGRPSLDPELIQLIRRMWQANPTWGSPRIRDELRSWACRFRTPVGSENTRCDELYSATVVFPASVAVYVCRRDKHDRLTKGPCHRSAHETPILVGPETARP